MELVQAQGSEMTKVEGRSELLTSASFWQRVTTTAPFNIWDKCDEKPLHEKSLSIVFSCFAWKHMKRTFCWQLEKQHVIGLTPTQYILKETALSISGHYLTWLRTDYPRTMPVIGDILTRAGRESDQLATGNGGFHIKLFDWMGGSRVHVRFFGHIYASCVYFVIVATKFLR